ASEMGMKPGNPTDGAGRSGTATAPQTPEGPQQVLKGKRKDTPDIKAGEHAGQQKRGRDSRHIQPDRSIDVGDRLRGVAPDKYAKCVRRSGIDRDVAVEMVDTIEPD